jgi:hypothetical protein
MLASMTERPSQAPGRGGNKKIVVGPWKLHLKAHSAWHRALAESAASAGCASAYF